MVFIIKLYFDELMIVTTSRFLNSKNLLWERTNPSLAWLMPQQGFWPDDEVGVLVDKAGYQDDILTRMLTAFCWKSTYFWVSTLVMSLSVHEHGNLGVGGDGEEELHTEKHQRVLRCLQRAQYGLDGR